MIKFLAIIPVSCLTFCAATFPTAITPQPPHAPKPVAKVQGVKPVAENPAPDNPDDKLDRMEKMLVTLIGGQNELKQLSEKQIEATENMSNSVVLAIRESKPDFSELIAALKPTIEKKAVVPVKDDPAPTPSTPVAETYRTETRYRTAYRTSYRYQQQCVNGVCQMVQVPYQESYLEPYNVRVKISGSSTKSACPTTCGCNPCTCENCTCGVASVSIQSLDVVPVPDDGGNPPIMDPSPDNPPIMDDGGNGCPPRRLFQGRILQRTWMFWRNIRGRFLNRRIMRFNSRG